MMPFSEKVAAYDEIFRQKYFRDDWVEMLFRRKQGKNRQSADNAGYKQLTVF